MRRPLVLLAACCAAAALAALSLRRSETTALAQLAEPKADPQAQVAQLQAQVKHLEGVVPD